MNQSDFFKIYFQGAENMPYTVSVHVTFFGKLVLTSTVRRKQWINVITKHISTLNIALCLDMFIAIFNLLGLGLTLWSRCDTRTSEIGSRKLLLKKMTNVASKLPFLQTSIRNLSLNINFHRKYFPFRP